MSKQGKERANGPYKHGQRWRVVFTGANGASETESFESEAKAIEARDAFNAQAGSRTLSVAVAEYINSLPERSRETARFRLHGFFRLPADDRPLNAITEAVAHKLYEQRTKEVAVATHHGELGYAKRFAGYAVGKGWLRANPVNVQPIGEPNRGKPKLRVKETRTYLASLLADESLEATAVLTALTFSLRASAVVNRLVEDLDDDGWILWVRDNKTRAGDLEIEVPAFLRERLVKLAKGKGPKERLFGDLTRHGLHYHTTRLCKEAGVSRVTPHGLRGSGATQKVRSGEAIERVAKEIGHADKGVTLKRAYLGGGAIESGRARAIEELVGGGPSAREVNESERTEEPKLEGWN